MAKRALVALSLLDVEYIAFQLAEKLMEYGEPFPSFETRFPDRLESCLETPFTRLYGKGMYLGVEHKAAMLFYLMIKNHPFQNGNKRVAVATLFFFLHENGRWIDVTSRVLYEFAKQIAESEASEMRTALENIREFLKKHVVLLEGAETTEDEER